MSLKTIIRAMAPILPKRNIIDSITTLQTQLDSHVIPMLEKSSAAATTRDHKSGFSKHIEKQFADRKLLGSRDNFIGSTLNIVKLARKNLDTVQRFVNQNKVDNLAVEALDLKTVTLLNYVNAVTHVVDYSSRMINMFWIAENNVGAGRNQFDGVVKGEYVWLEENLPKFISELAAINIDDSDLDKKLNEMSGTVFDPDEEETTKSLIPRAKMDPLGFGFIPLSINPFYIVGRWYVEWQDSRYKAYQLDLQRVELRIKALEEASSGNRSPATEKTLIALDNLRKDIQLKLNKME